MSDSTRSYAYYPGCAEKTAVAYGETARHVLQALGLTVKEVDDWNCCGATEYFSVNRLPAYSLVARNLSLAAELGIPDLVASCSACYLNLRKTETNMGKYPKLGEEVNQALRAGGLHYEPGTLRVRHLLDVFVDDVGFDALKAKVTKPLVGLRVAPYYGCLIARPYGESCSEYPTNMDKLLETLGAEVVDFPAKTYCCGGHMTQISEDTGLELIRRILQNAADAEADVLAVLCPMCQLNMDMYQSQVNRAFGTNYSIPVLYFTQLMGLAMGFDKKQVHIGKELVSAEAALKKIGQKPEAKKKPRRDKNALPMPSMKGC